MKTDYFIPVKTFLCFLITTFFLKNTIVLNVMKLCFSIQIFSLFDKHICTALHSLF
jgi:hypothetical protein